MLGFKPPESGVSITDGCAAAVEWTGSRVPAETVNGLTTRSIQLQICAGYAQHAHAMRAVLAAAAILRARALSIIDTARRAYVQCTPLQPNSVPWPPWLACCTYVQPLACMLCSHL